MIMTKWSRISCLKFSVFMNDLLLKDSTSQKLDTDLHGRKGGRNRKP
jgi:hypothetical protein